MKKIATFATCFILAAVASCVTINIYFPAEEVRSAADKIVNEVWSELPEGQPDEKTPPPAQEGSPQSSLPWWRSGPAVAHAAQDINVSTPEIRAIKAAMKERAAALRPHLDSGNVGIGTDGQLEIRGGAGLGLKARGSLKRLVSAENNDRLQLYREIARANGLPGQEAQVQEVFAASWRAQAATGWYLKQANGSWTRKE